MNSSLSQRLISSIVLLPPLLLFIYFGDIYFFFILFLILMLGLKEIYKLKTINFKLTLSLIYFFFIFSSYEIRAKNNGEMFVFLIIIITILSDTGGFFFGKAFGKHKINFISPNKTYEGFVGSILLTQFSHFYFFYFDFFLFQSVIITTIFLIISSIMVIVGDLFFSYCKRRNGIKDFGKIIPGHGGILDRIDGMIFLTIFYTVIFV